MNWKFFFNCVGISILMLLLTSNLGFAESGNYLSKKVGFGYQGMILGSSSLFNGLSARGWINKNFGLEGNLSYLGIDVEYDDSTNTEADLTNFDGKVLYAPIVKKHSRFYFGGKIGYGQLSTDSSSVEEDTDMISFGAFIGSEWNFTEVPELGFNFDVGYNYTNIDADDVELGFDGIGVSMGIHYYF